MSQADLAQSLAALHAEIDKLEATDIAVKEKLLVLIDDIEKQMQVPDGQMTSRSQPKVTQKLPELIEQFELEHPQITNSLNRLLTTLSGMGI